MTVKLAIFTACALLSGTALAAEGTGFYVGADLGEASSDIKKGEIDNGINSAFEFTGFAIDSSKLGKTDTTYGVFVGYRFLPYLATELSYFGTGKANYKASGTVLVGETPTPVDVNLDWESKGPALSVIGILPFMEAWDVYARVGVFFADTKVTAKATSTGVSSGSFDQSKNTTEFIWGVGGGYTFLDHWTVRLEYQGLPNLGDKNNTGEFNVDRITLGMLYRF